MEVSTCPSKLSEMVPGGVSPTADDSERTSENVLRADRLTDVTGRAIERVVLAGATVKAVIAVVAAYTVLPLKLALSE